jgi:WD40 repeat protein
VWPARFRLRVVGMAAATVLASTLLGPPALATPGTEQWSARFPGPQFSGEDVAGLAVSPDGSRVFMAGTLDAFSHPTMWTVAYDSFGTQLWARRGTNPEIATAAAISMSPDGSALFVTGRVYTDTNSDFVTIAYDPTTGVRLWKRRFSSSLGNSRDEVAALGLSPDGSTVFVTGTSGGPFDTDYTIVAYAADTGRQLWTARYDGGNRDEAQALSVSPDGSSVFVSGFTFSTTALDIETVAYDAITGERRWKARYNGPASRDDQANAMSASPDGSTVYVAGFTEASNRARDFVTLAYRASTGSLRWVRRYDGPRDSNDNVKAMTVSGSRVFVAGYRTGHYGRDAETIAYSQAGGRLWLRAYSPPRHEAQATAIGVSPDGRRVYTVGFRSTDPFPDKDFATLAYKAFSGVHSWEAFYDHDDDAIATAIGVSPDGAAVYTSGSSGYDLATIAYSTS